MIAVTIKIWKSLPFVRPKKKRNLLFKNRLRNEADGKKAYSLTTPGKRRVVTLVSLLDGNVAESGLPGNFTKLINCTKTTMKTKARLIEVQGDQEEFADLIGS